MDITPVNTALDRFIEKLIALQPEAPRIFFNADWPSPCYQQHAQSGVSVAWRPTRQTESTDMFDRLSMALEEPLHPDIVSYYSRYWSDPLPAIWEGEPLSLLQAWNPEDLERLRENLIGHALNKRRSKMPLTIFFACVEPDTDYFISLDNQSGQVVLEKPGKPVIRVLANSLAEFLEHLTPTAIPDQD
ncbi:SecY-interacting protein [Neptuniibacter sp. CAU 1671]|uniref:SecY-interacting protein n=1 Tax=Neptuniibacter sp. CAU 1671 TaxID=3032593 RepID=UPI0023DA2511|nr:SecY-interacting protein [Neptuniibacter sp. CAU 1671]MDF2182760.1 SecY-interacting protein [Neptuniibacter sp. CAU 1671]